MIEVKLTHNEMFDAVFQYVKREYPELQAKNARLQSDRGHFTATVKCEYVRRAPEGNLFGTT